MKMGNSTGVSLYFITKRLILARYCFTCELRIFNTTAKEEIILVNIYSVLFWLEEATVS